MVHGDFKPSDILISANAKVPKITNFGLWDFKKFFIENTMAEDVVFLNPHQAPEVSEQENTSGKRILLIMLLLKKIKKLVL